MKNPVEASLSEKPLFKVLGELVNDKATGYLTVSGKADTVVVSFEFGMCVGIESHYPKENNKTGRLLVVRSIITEEQLEIILIKQKEQLMKFGRIARDEGFVTTNQLMDVLEDQMVLILFPCLTWTSGLFHFRAEHSIVYDKDAFRPLDLSPILKFGEMILQNWSWIQERFPNFEAIPSLLSNVEVLPPGVQVAETAEARNPTVVLTPEQEIVYNQINGVFTIQTIIDSCHQLPWLTLNAIADLEDQGAITIPTQKESKSKYGMFWEEFLERIRDSTRYLAIVAGVIIFLLLVKVLPVRMFPGFPDRTAMAEIGTMTKAKMDQIRFGLDVYYFLNARYPEFLLELVDGRYLREKDLYDCWGVKIYYRKLKNGYVLVSEGPDHQWSTADDITSTTIKDDYPNGCFLPVWVE